ncbi:MAG: DUF6600 domain-containing protein [Gemmatimonadota bacterium]
MYTHDVTQTTLQRTLADVARGLVLAAGVWLGGAEALSAQEPPTPSEYDQAGPGADLEGTYGYVRTLDGSGTLIPSGGERIQLRTNEPVLVGDRLFVSGDSRAEIVLADRNLVRLGDGADLGFRALAYSADAKDPATVLTLRRGTVQFVVVKDQLGQAPPSIETPNSNIRFVESGLYLVVVDDDERTEVVVREGRAEVRTDSDAAEVRQGETLSVKGSRTATMQFAAAPSLDDLEAWGDGLGDYSAGQYAEYVDSDLQYSTSALEGNGSWVSVGTSWAWRPYVSAGWAPYRNGRWRYAPTGWIWVSYDPWGWAPQHYGYWNYASSYGWLWYPGRRFAGAHVYFYWGNGGYAGWAPTGYYWPYYRPRYGSSYGYYNGVYGWVNGSSWYSRNRYWTFARTDRLGRRDQQMLSGQEFGRRGLSLGRGLLTTDTRALRPDVWRRPGEGLTRLTRQGSLNGRQLGNATPFVDRVDKLPSTLERVTLRGRGGSSRTADVSSRSGGGTLRSNARDIESRRPNIETGIRNVDRATLRRPTSGRPGAGDAGRVTGRSRSGASVSGGTLRRPETQGTTRPTMRRPTIDRGPTSTDRISRRGPRAAPPAVGRQSTDRGELRRPSSPVTRTPTVGRSRSGSRPTVRSGSRSSSRPSVRSGSSGGSRPTVRGASRGDLRRPSSPVARTPTVGRSQSRSRPAVRSGSRSSSRPSVRSGSSGGSRPSVRSRPSGGSRPSVRSGSSGRSRPAVRSRPSGPSRSSGATRSSGPSRRSSASRSSGSRRSSASRSSGGSRRSGASRSSGSRRSGASRSSGGSRRSGASRSSGSRRSGGGRSSGSRSRRGG